VNWFIIRTNKTLAVVAWSFECVELAHKLIAHSRWQWASTKIGGTDGHGLNLASCTAHQPLPGAFLWTDKANGISCALYLSKAVNRSC
jgi:hypothetical protein